MQEFICPTHGVIEENLTHSSIKSSTRFCKVDGCWKCVVILSPKLKGILLERFQEEFRENPDTFGGSIQS